jgi:hypothetical protein
MSSLEALAAAADAAAPRRPAHLNVPGRYRDSNRAQKARPKSAYATPTKRTATGKPQITVFAPGSSVSAPHRRRPMTRTATARTRTS